MRIGIDIRNIGKRRTGDEVVFLNLVRELVRLDSENEYFLFLEERSNEALRDIEKRLCIVGKKNFCLVTLPANNKFDWNLWYVPRYLRKNAIDIYHTQYIVPFFVPKRTKVVTHIHDVSFCAFPKYIAFLDRFFLGALIPRSLRRADLIVAPSEFTKQEIIRYYGDLEEKISVVYNAVAPEFFEERAMDLESRESIRKKYHLPKTFLLYVGTLQPRKNIPALLKAFARIRAEDSELGLVLVGNRTGHHSDPEIDEALRRLGLESAVVFPGFVDQQDLPLVFAFARAFIFPSRYEGFGIPILEAMSQDVPVVASDIPALREAGGDAALFVSTDDAEAFSAALRTACLSGSIRETLIQKGLVRARFFSWEQSARSLLASYEKICFHKKTVS
jgi:glycosyltransferase involved in cell wall biosynthesis